MQSPIYTNEEEMELMSWLWADDIANRPLRFVNYAYPWGEIGTPLENAQGPRRWQRRVLRRLEKAIQANREKTPDEQNRLIWDAYRKAVASGRGIGKSSLVAWLVHWFLSTRVGGTAIISANTQAQLEGATWGEISKWIGMSINSHWFELAATTVQPAKWIRDIVQRDLRKNTKLWGAQAKLWSEENPDAYAGVHNMDGVLLIFDEASGIADNIWSVAAGFFTENTPNRFWFAFSNPRRNRGYFFECFNSKRDFWSVDNINGLDVEDIDHKVFLELIDEFGPESYEAHVEVYGEFPEQGEDQFISPMVVQGAQQRPQHMDASAPVVVGVDPARSGLDSTCIVVRQGRDLVFLKRYRNTDLMVTVQDVVEIMESWEPDLVVIDEGGVGAGVVDRLNELGYKVKGVMFGAAPRNPKMYRNKRTEMWGDMRTWLATASLVVAGKDKRLKTDLTGPMIEHDGQGIMALESKESMKKRKLASPDAADAIAVTFAYPVRRRRQFVDARRGSGHTMASHSASWMGS